MLGCISGCMHASSLACQVHVVGFCVTRISFGVLGGKLDKIPLPGTRHRVAMGGTDCSAPAPHNYVRSSMMTFFFFCSMKPCKCQELN